MRDAVHTLRAAIPGVTLRTSLIVGFPGETEKDFQELVDFVQEAQFERLGVFKYSREKGTAAGEMDRQIPEKVKERRWQEIMEVQAEISRRKNEGLIGTVQQAMMSGLDIESGRMVGRTQAHAPEVDGVVYIEDHNGNQQRTSLEPGDLRDVKITGALDYDLIGEILDA